MVEQEFIDYIEQLRHSTFTKLTEIQKNLCPMVKSVYLDFRLEYWYEGYKHTLWEDDVHIYAIDELPYCYDNELRNTTFIETVDTLISEDKVWPFLMFINGKVVPWSKITVIHDYTYTYLKIEGIEEDYSLTSNLIEFPLASKQIRYGEDSDISLTTSKGLYFDKEGLLISNVDFSNVGLRFEILDPNVYYRRIDMYNMLDIIKFEELPDGYVPTLDNIITFTADGYYQQQSQRILDIYNGSYGLFKLDQTVETELRWAILMYNQKNENKSASYIYSKSNDLNKKAIFTLLTENSGSISSKIWEEVITPLIDLFDFSYDYGASEDNVYNATSYISQYDFSLWKNVFVAKSKVKSYTYTGTEFKSLMDSKGYVRYSRRHGVLVEDTVMVFVNHKLFLHMTDVTYTNNTINIPTFGIQDDDHVEIVLFTECNNNIMKISVPDNQTLVYIHPEYNLEDCILMSEEASQTAYPLPIREDKRTQYEVEFTYTVNEKSEYLIQFTNLDYYGKQLSVVPKRQYNYYRFKHQASQYRFTLPTQFNYCHNSDQYMVFVNCKKIDKTEYTLTIPSTSRPFGKIELYLSTILDEEDIVDVFYLPEECKEKYKKDVMPKCGLILLEDYPKTYPLSKYTSMIFINGLKVNPLNIKDVSIDSVLIDVDKYYRNEDGTIKTDATGAPIEKRHYVNSINNITIVEYIKGSEELSAFLSTGGDNWKLLIKTLLDKYSTESDPYAGLQKIFGAIFSLNDPDEDYKTKYADLKSVLYDAILNYYLYRDDVSTGGEFVYDLENQEFEKSGDTTMIPLMPDKDKLVDYDSNTEVATPEDVENGYLFTTP